MMNRMFLVAIASLLAGCQQPLLDRETISTDKAPAAIGPYSQAIRVGNRLYLSGQIGIDPATGQIAKGGIEGQTHQALKNLGAILESAGFSFNDVVQAQVFLADLNDYAKMNAVYRTYFDESFPARAAVQVARIPRDARVEIMMVAVRK
jgi:2-iminobutanoate/2-iminopropanoate deaminase